LRSGGSRSLLTSLSWWASKPPPPYTFPRAWAISPWVAVPYSPNSVSAALSRDGLAALRSSRRPTSEPAHSGKVAFANLALGRLIAVALEHIGHVPPPFKKRVCETENDTCYSSRCSSFSNSRRFSSKPSDRAGGTSGRGGACGLTLVCLRPVCGDGAGRPAT